MNSRRILIHREIVGDGSLSFFSVLITKPEVGHDVLPVSALRLTFGVMVYFSDIPFSRDRGKSWTRVSLGVRGSLTRSFCCHTSVPLPGPVCVSKVL